MVYPKLSLVILLHDEVIKTSGGSKGYNQTSIGYLDSALSQIQNDDYYPEFIDKLTHLVFSCVKFHPFNDGNKRTAITLGMLFLELNDYSEYASAFYSVLEDIVVDLAKDKISKDDLKSIIYNILY